MPKFATLVSLVFLGLFASGLNPVHAASSGYAVADVNLRSGPGFRYRVKAVIPRRARITIYRCRVRWCRVSWRGIRGWTSRRYVAFTRTYRPRRRVYRPPFYDPYYDDPFYDPFYGPPRIYYPRRGGVIILKRGKYRILRR